MVRKFSRLQLAMIPCTWVLADGQTSVRAGTILPALPSSTYSGSFSATVSGGYFSSSDNASTSQAVTGPTNLGFQAVEPSKSNSTGVIISNAASNAASLNFSATPSPAIYVSGTANTIGGTPGSASFYLDGELTYNLEVVGASGTVPVHVNASGSATISSEGTSIYDSVSLSAGFTVLSVGTRNNDTVGQIGLAGWWDRFDLNARPTNNTSPISRSFSENSVYDLQANTLYEVAMFATISATSGGSLGGSTESATAFVDPTFTVAASNPSQYTLVLSSGVGNSSAQIPEPPTLALFSGALLSVGAVRRRWSRSH